ncbi:MAG: hypothetical protein E6L07_08305 [Verrucomicrobia bacterium]|nr:MAG: hypothetical protein E6L07_08305 [Verrucomicrobiota bacterium]
MSLLRGEQKRQNPPRVMYWEIIADNLSKAAFSWGWVSAVDSGGRTILLTRIATMESVSLCVRMKS